MAAISFKDVKLTYKNKKNISTAVDNLSFDVQKSEIVGLIGPNGAGKSTTIKMITGILTPDTGSVKIMDLNPAKDKKNILHRIGVMFGNRSSLWYNIPAIKSVKLMKDIYGIDQKDFKKRLDEISDLLDLKTILEQPVRTLSLGQRIKVELLVSILHNPDVLILDEPTIGLDIVSKNQFRDKLLELSQKNRTTVLITTHDLSDIEKICDRVIFINKGKKLLDLSRKEFTNLCESKIAIKTQAIQAPPLEQYLREKNNSHNRYILPVEKKREIIDFLNLKDISFSTEKVNLEDVLYEYYSKEHKNNL